MFAQHELAYDAGPEPTKCWSSQSLQSLHQSRCAIASTQEVLDDLNLLHAKVVGNSQDLVSARALISEAIARLIGHVRTQLGPASPTRKIGGLASWQLSAVDRVIELRLADKLQIADLARACRVSEAHFCRAFRATRGITAMRYVSEFRIGAAEQRLTESSLPLCEIALSCGFADQAHFTRVFRAATGETPKRWQRRRATASE